jgi:hypothetical protein
MHPIVSRAGRAEGFFVETVVIAAISAALSLSALAISVFLARRQSDLQAVLAILARRSTDLKMRVAAIEEARRTEEMGARRRARVTARFDTSFQVLHLINHGPAAAREVSVEVRPVGEGEPIALDLGDLPVDLRPGQQLLLDSKHGSQDATGTITATVRWTDDAGAQDELFVLNTRYSGEPHA